MAMTTTGTVQRLLWMRGDGPMACVWVGGKLDSVEGFFIYVRADDSDAEVRIKSNWVLLLVGAQVGGFPVNISHGTTGGEVTGVAWSGWSG